MKTAKKVLSIILAVMMAFGVCAVAVSANGNPATATHKVTMKLTANVNGVDYDSNDAIPVNPGDKLSISIWCKNNYYAGVFNAQVFYTAALLDPKGKDPNISKANLKKTYSWNTDSEYIEMSAPKGMCSYWSGFVDSAKSNGWPMNDEGNVVVDMDNYHYTLMFAYPDPETYEETVQVTNLEKFLTYTLYVPESAASGQSYKVYIPEGCIRNSTYKTGPLYLTEYVNGEVGGDTNDYMSDDQYFDLSGATLNFQVAGATELDYSALQTKYDEVKDTVLTNYTDTTAFSTALAAASTMLTNKDAADQSAITTATSNLDTAFKALVLKNADYTALDAAIASCGTTYVSTNYTSESWSPFELAVSAGQNVSRSLKITDQATVDAATKAITDAAAALKYAGANYSALTQAIEDAEAKTQSWYTTNTWSALSTAVSAGKAIAAGLDITHQSEIDTAAANINTAITNLVEADANYTNLDAAIALAGTKEQGDYTAQSWADMQAKLQVANGVSRTLKAKDQTTVDTATTELNSAISNLIAIGSADYSSLIAEINAGTDYAEAKYTTESWAAYSTKLTEAQTMVNDNNLKATQQSQVDAMEAALIRAKADLVKVGADYTAVDAALTKIPADLSNYVLSTVATLTQATNAVIRGLDFTYQTQVDKMASDIETAIAGLEFKAANTAELDAAIAAADAVNTATYTPATVETFNEALAAAKAVRSRNPLDVRDQSDIDSATSALTTAQSNLVPLGANYTALDSAIADYESRTQSWYTEATWLNALSKYQDAVAIKNGPVLDITQQSTIDDAVTALNNALSGLVEANADYSAVDAAKLKAPSTARRAVYTDASLQVLDEAIAAVVTGLKVKDQSIVDGYAAAINTAYDALEFKPFDYTTTNGYIDSWNALQANEDQYTKATWAAAKELFDNVVLTYDQGDLSKAMIQQNNLKKALAALTIAGAADYSDVLAAQNAAGELNRLDYTTASWSNLQAALSGIVLGLNENHQDEVDGFASAINDAIDALVKLADFSALNTAIADANALDSNDYTAASWATLAEAVTTGNSMSRQLAQDQQSVVDAATQSIRSAIAGLEVKSTSSAIKSVTYTKSDSEYNDFAVKVMGRPEKVRFTDPSGNTFTYNRYHDAVTIVSYDKSDSIVNSLSKDLAYEIWTIHVKMPINKTMKATARFSGVFESIDLAYEFNVSLAEPVLDTTVYSMNLASQSGPKGKVVATVATGADVQAVRFINEQGETCTYAASTATLTDGKLVFTGNTWNHNSGNNTTTVKVKIKGVWQDAGTLSYVAE